MEFGVTVGAILLGAGCAVLVAMGALRSERKDGPCIGKRCGL